MSVTKIEDRHLDAAAAFIDEYWSGTDNDMNWLAAGYRNRTRQAGIFPRMFAQFEAAHMTCFPADLAEKAIAALKPFATEAECYKQAEDATLAVVTVGELRKLREVFMSLCEAETPNADAALIKYYERRGLDDLGAGEIEKLYWAATRLANKQEGRGL